MAEYRTLRMTFWNDPYVEELGPEGRLFYLYLITCPHTNNLGLLEVSHRRMAYETSLAEEVVRRLLAEAEAAGKLVTDGSQIWLVNFVKHQASTSPKLVQSLRALLARVSSRKIRGAVASAYPALFPGMAGEGDDPGPLPAAAPAGEGPAFPAPNNGLPSAGDGPRPCISPGEEGFSPEHFSRAFPTVGEGYGRAVPTAGAAAGNKEGDEEGAGQGKARFRPPTPEEVQAYCDARGNGIEARAFVDFYASKGWKVGASPMKDWRAAVRTWESRRREGGAMRRVASREENNGEAVRRAVERMASAAALREEKTW